MLEKLDLTKQVKSKKAYKKQLKKYQLRLRQCEQAIGEAALPVLLAFEGWDAGGKGGVIRRVLERMDSRGYEVHQIGPPSEQEQTHHYLRRFWLRLPRRGQLVIFDRSWYGRVLVERVEGFATRKEWKRSYDEINTFEKMLADNGTLIMKFWMHITPEEQLRRFKNREQSPFKRWKLTPDDWRNREKWSEYEEATEEMLVRTDTSWAPWTLIEGNYKWYARIKVLKSITDRIGDTFHIRWMDQEKK